LFPGDNSPDRVEGRVVEMLLPIEPDLVLGLPVAVVPVFEGPDVFRTPGVAFLGEVSVVFRFGAGKLLLKLLLIDTASDPFIICELPGRVF
jgi:hypothetical protein